MIFFTADTHFHHAKAIEFSRRPFGSVEEMNNALVSGWRDTVTDEDVVYHLGDFAWTWNAETRNILARLPGEKHLIVGNHDHSATRGAKAWASVRHYAELNVRDGRRGDLKLVLCHYPFAVWNGNRRGAVNLHGHAHGTYPASRLQMDVGVDCVDYRPISLTDALDRLETFPETVHRDGQDPGADLL